MVDPLLGGAITKIIGKELLFFFGIQKSIQIKKDGGID
tara:strand:- start:807 stop:920 length:114 start_codon:yes stop_codon:yes gene_type:complete